MTPPTSSSTPRKPASSSRSPRGLREYARKRDFAKTPEPRGRAPASRGKSAFQFVVQQHAARRLHYDFRLELDGVLKSWAIPKGPSLDTGERRMAVATEDHPIDYADFEGVIPKGEYGGGTVVVWDRGRWEPVGNPHAALQKGHLEFRLRGEKLRGRWHLVRMRPRASDRGRESWLLIKASDAEAKRGREAAITERARESVISGRDLAAVARAADRVWSSRQGGERVRRLGGERAVAKRTPKTVAAPEPELPRRALPRTLAPQLATLVEAAPEGAEWLHEIKLDGYRILARLEAGKAQLLSRNGRNWTAQFPGVAKALTALAADSALLDGEVVALDAKGRSRFQLLQNALAKPDAELFYYAFDLLHLDGFDLRAAPLLARKQLLRRLLGRIRKQATIRFSEHVQGGGPGFFAQACKLGAEGIVSKRADSAYRSARTRSWLKVKCGRRQELVIVGYSDPRGSRVGLGALLLGVYDDAGSLHYAGKVGTGFSAQALRDLRGRLGNLEQKQPSVVDPSRAERGAHWVRPSLVAEVAFTEWTHDGSLRHPTFIALRSDKPPSAIRREVPERAPRSGKSGAASRAIRAKTRTRSRVAPGLRSEVAGVRLSHPERVYFPDLGVTKSELAQYYETLSERALPAIAERPLSLVRCPNGCDKKCFYQKHAGEGLSDRVGRVVIAKGEAPYTYVKDLASLIELVQMSVIEFHVWGARVDRIDQPDLLVFDLDPDPSVAWRRVAETAHRLREFLAELELAAFVRTTGGKGLHIVSPIVRRASWEEVKTFTHNVALRFVRAEPGRFTARIPKRERRGKILIDYLRNQRDATAIASYSVRARPGAPVAMPLAWDELDPGASKAPAWSVREAPSRLELADPWKDFEASRRVLGKSAQARVRID